MQKRRLWRTEPEEEKEKRGARGQDGGIEKLGEIGGKG